jgi:hypothetical protein
MKSWAVLITKLILLFESLYKEYKQHERQKAIDKVYDNPTDAWDARFGVQPRDDSEADK